jgi:putative MATE family efflux protein
VRDTPRIDHPWHEQRRVLFHLGLPIFLETFLRMLINNVNVFMISKLSDETVGAVGVANQILNFLLMVYACIAFGTAVLISQNLGAGRRHVAMDSANTAIVLSATTGLSLGLLLIPAAPFLLTLMRVPPQMMDAAVSYLRIVGAASVFQALVGTMSAISRNYRYARIPMIITLGMNGMNLAGNVMVVYRPFGLPDFGVVGIAVSAAVSQGIAAIVMFVLLFSHREMNLRFSIPRPFPYRTVGRILAIGLPGGGDSLFYSLMMIATTYIITGIGPDALTASVYLSSLISFVQVLGFSVGQATMIQVGHLVGAGKDVQAYRFSMRSHWLAMALNGTVCVIFVIFSRQLLGIFTDNPAIIAIGMSVFLVDLFLEPGRPWNMVVATALRASGDVVWPVIVSILSLWGVCVPLAFLLGSVLGFGLPGVYAAYAADEYVRGLLMFVRWRSGVWRKNRVVEVPDAVAFSS